MSSLPTDYQNFIHQSRYARWRDEDNRREYWTETVDRYFDFFSAHLAENHKLILRPEERGALQAEVGMLGAMPSMRCMMTAGRALQRDHVAGYNCAYRAIDDVRAFDEILYILMCGTGVGFSVERQYVNKLPVVPEVLEDTFTVITVHDSKQGWGLALRELLAMLYAGRIPKWDTSKLRPAGARLKTMGGRSSGPGPLIELFEFTVQLFREAAGRKLTSIECHDLACKIGDCVVVGGVRRSALLSLSNLSDQRMQTAKSGQWWELAPWRALSNNSVAYTERPEVGQFMREWLALYDSKSGERGIFNREAARKQAMSNGRRRGFWDEAGKDPIEFGTNPCSEIILRSREFCNLTEVVARAGDRVQDLERKVRTAAILGTWQSTLTRFRYLGKSWQSNCEEERLLGVSITGMLDCRLLNGRSGRAEAGELMQHLKGLVRDTNVEWAERLGVPPSAANTCVKPSGTVSQLVRAASGVHPQHAPAFIRRVRQDIKDPLTHFMIEQGFPAEPDVTKPKDMMVFSFPMRAPEDAICRDDLSAIQHLEYWKLVQDNWCEHKPSITVTVKEKEWPSVGAWVWDNFDSMSGVAFLPHSGHTYRQAPYETVSNEALTELEEKMPKGVDWSALASYESEDNTTGVKELACSAGACEL